jgi:hypothetical protein
VLDLREIVCQVDVTGSVSCSVAGFDIGGYEPSGNATTVLVGNSLSLSLDLVLSLA